MPVTNADVADLFEHMAELLEVQRENPFRVRAYRRAAQTISGLGESVATMVERGDDLTELPGIGDDLAGKIAEIVARGRLAALDRLARRLPGQVAEMLRLPGLGPKRVALLHEKLGIRTLAQLEAACRDGKVRDLPGIGEKTEARILEALAQASPVVSGRTRIDVAGEVVAPLVEHLRGCPAVKDLVVAGSFRRRAETVGDLDILAVAGDAKAAVERFTRYDTVREVLAAGDTRASVMLQRGLQVDLRVVGPEAAGAALLYLTGSKAHNIALRKRAIARGLKLNEYGLFRGRTRVAGRSEKEVYAALDLPFVEPELREDRGELDAAEAGRLPRLVAARDLRGDLHAHTDASDGMDSLEAMAEAAEAAGYEYLAITDHTRHLAIAHGLDPRRLARQLGKIDRLNAKRKGLVLLKSAEVDILEDGTLDLPDSLLAELDLVVAAVHSHFSLSAAAQTRRVLRAMDNARLGILAHPTGRLIGERAPYAIDLERVMQGAVERGCFLELNAQPERLDANDVACRRAKEMGLKVAISTDAHSADDLGLVRYGIDQARRAWLEPDDVLNTRSLAALRKLLRR